MVNKDQGDRDRLQGAMVARGIPAYMHMSILRYVCDRQPVGSFLTALLQDKLSAAVMSADEDNRAALEQWIALMVWDLPGACWGSVQKVDAWMGRR